MYEDIYTAVKSVCNTYRIISRVQTCSSYEASTILYATAAAAAASCDRNMIVLQFAQYSPYHLAVVAMIVIMVFIVQQLTAGSRRTEQQQSRKRT